MTALDPKRAGESWSFSAGNADSPGGRAMASKQTISKKITVSKDPPHSRGGKVKADPSKRRRSGPPVSPYPAPPRELAGKWVAWSRYQIVASGDTLAGVMDRVAAEGIKGASYELLPELTRGS
jgi:hypothetical protein